MPQALTLGRPTGPAEPTLVRASGRREWPPRLPERLLFPVLDEDHATRIAPERNEWSLLRDGEGHVTRSGSTPASPRVTRPTGGWTHDPGAVGAGRGAGWVQRPSVRADRAGALLPSRAPRGGRPLSEGAEAGCEGATPPDRSRLWFGPAEQVRIDLGQNGHDLAEGVGEQHGFAVGALTVLVGRAPSGFEGEGHEAAGAWVGVRALLLHVCSHARRDGPGDAR